MIYLASPYSSPDPFTVYARYAATESFMAKALYRGKIIFSPIIHCHHLSERYDLPGDFEFWKNYNLGMLDAADTLWVLKLDGWEDSKGVAGEILYAKMKNKEIQYVPTTYFG